MSRKIILIKQELLLLDRKSGSAGMTRPISYAVFCLKKKNGFKLSNFGIAWLARTMSYKPRLLGGAAAASADALPLQLNLGVHFHNRKLHTLGSYSVVG